MTLRHNNIFLKRKNIALLSLVAISAFALLYTPLRGAITEALYSVTPGIWSSGRKTESVFGSFITNFRNKEALVEENNLLGETVAVMEAKVLDRNLLAEKVAKLEETLGRAHSDDRVVGSVLVGPGRSPYDTLVIDVGTDQGVNIANMVVYSGSGAIGEIVEVTPTSSKVKLYSFPGQEHSVIIGARSLPVLAYGRGMGNFESKVPQDSPVLAGDTVVSVKGKLIFGKVSVVEEKPAEPFKRIFFRVPFNITEIQTVEVIVGKRL